MLLKMTHDGDDAPPAPWKYKANVVIMTLCCLPQICCLPPL